MPAGSLVPLFPALGGDCGARLPKLRAESLWVESGYAAGRLVSEPCGLGDVARRGGVVSVGAWWPSLPEKLKRDGDGGGARHSQG